MAGMLREEEDTAGSRGRKMFWRSASWSSSRTAQQNSSHFEDVNDCADRDKNNGGQFGRYPLPVTPRSQQNCKARACLPPLQPLSIARRSLDEWPKAGSDDVGVWPQPPTPSGRGDLSRLKLDLSSFQKNPDPTASLVNRDKIAYFDKECSKVADHIYLGGDAVAKNRDILRQNGITHVLNCVGFVCPEYFKADLVYKTLWLQDSPSEDITSILYDVFDYFEDVREQGGRVFVHCCQGVSRSTSLVIAYLMWREGQSFDDAFQYVKAARGIANPNMGFACQLLQCQKRVHAIPLSPSSLLRMYRMAPHSPYDPLHLVPKMLNDPSPSALDSRGAFIIHVPSAIYIWIGKTCEPIMERDAKGAAFQVVRYERVQGQIIIVKEGCEPSEFWDAFCSLPYSLDKSCNGVQVGKEQLELAVKINPGDRKVEAYDAEFELLQKATSGGIVPPFSLSETGHETHLPTRESNWSVLRRKFATGRMKEFVSAPKMPLFRVYSDSVLMIDSDNHVNKLSAFSADSSTSSSPSYLSPSSFSSDLSSSSRFSADSLSLSPSTSSRSLTPSPGPSPLADSSLSSIKNSILPVTTNPKTLSIANTTKLPSQAVLSSKPSILSLAERRGGLLTSFKLPILNDVPSFSSRRTKIGSLACQQDESEGNYKLDGLRCKEEFSDTKEGAEREKGDVLLEDCLIETSVRDGSSCENETCRESQRNCPLQECEPSILTGLVNNGFHLCNGIQPVVRRWPGFVKVAAFDAGYLDSNFVYLFLASSAGVDRHADRMLYFWIGKSFKHDKSQSELNNSKNIGEAKDFDCNQIAFEFFTLMSLPKGIPVKVVKEKEEPPEFLELLKCL